MKSTSNTKFTMEDFEKGLMLAGYILPSSIQELNEKEALEKHDLEKKAKSQPASKNIYFKRVVLAAEILYKLHGEATMGKVKFQKLVYLCEHAAGMQLESRYIKQAAGPFDNKFMHTIHSEFKKLQWFDLEKIQSNSFARYIYKPLDNVEKYKQYYSSYYHQADSEIQRIIELFRKAKTDTTELAATVLACSLELNQRGSFSRAMLLNLFYDWSEAKSKFTEERVVRCFQWLNENHIMNVSFQ